MQPRFPPPGSVPPPGMPPGRMPPPPMFHQPGGFPPAPFYPPGGMPPPMQPVMHPGMHPGMHGGMHGPGQLQGMPPPPMYSAPQVQYSAPPVPPRPAASVIVGAPVMRTAVAAAAVPTGATTAPLPPTPAPMVVVSATSAIHDFNFSNPSAVFLSATSNLVNKHIFQNPAAALPLTLYIGQVPLDMTDSLLTKVLESCGKIFKLTRPVDPATQLPASFALVTYAQALCAVRALRTLNGFVLEGPTEGEGECSDAAALVVKAGSRETAALESISKSEDEASAQLTEGYCLQTDIYAPIRESIRNLLSGNNAPAVVVAGPLAGNVPVGVDAGQTAGCEGGVSSSAAGSSTTEVQQERPPAPTSKRPSTVEAGEIEEGEVAPTTTTTTTTTAAPSGNYYNRLDIIDSAVNGSTAGAHLPSTLSLADQVAADGAGEQMLMSEIGRFRLRQLQRDKDVEEQRKLKIKQKMQEMRALAQAKAERDARAAADGSSSGGANTAAADAFLDSIKNTTTTGSSTASSNVGEKRRADAISSTASTSTQPLLSAEEMEAKRRRKLQVLQMLAGDDNMVEPDTTTIAATTTATPTTTSTTTTTIPLKKVSLRKPTNVSGSSAFVRAEDEETAPKREMILLEYTAEELQEMANQTQQFLSYTTSSSNVGEDQDQLEEVYGRKQKASVMLADLGLSMPTTTTTTAATTAGISGAGLSGADLSSIQAKVKAQAQAISAALAMKSTGNSSTAGGAGGSGNVEEDEKARLKALVNKIPTEKDELFAYPLDWSILDHRNTLTEVMTGWVGKKIQEYLGEEEPQLCDFIVTKLRGHCKPVDLLEELSMVMDEDAALPFVLKLWRMLVYYSVKG